jgi:hypothetical protein
MNAIQALAYGIDASVTRASATNRSQSRNKKASAPLALQIAGVAGL